MIKIINESSILNQDELNEKYMDLTDKVTRTYKDAIDKIYKDLYDNEEIIHEVLKEIVGAEYIQKNELVNIDTLDNEDKIILSNSVSNNVDSDELNSTLLSYIKEFISDI